MDFKVLKYGIACDVNEFPSELDLELTAFRLKQTPEKGGLGPYKHFRNAANILYPSRIHHDWSDWRFENLCEYDWNSWAGCASSGKSDDAVFFALMWWIASPLTSAVIMTSTTRQMIRKRSWSVLQRLWDSFPGKMPCNKVDSKMVLQAQRGDDKHSISAIAIREGTLSKAVGDIQGHHCDRILVIIDEAEETPEAIYDACANLQAGTSEFKLLEIANPQSKFTAFGRHIEPKKGWGSITVDSEEWETRNGICLHFDGEKSPNVILGETRYPFLINQRGLDRIINQHGGKNTIGYWKFGRGYLAPEGISDALISENALVRSDCFGKLVFQTEKTKIAGLDPAFTSGGDKCKLQFGEMGDLEDGRIGINLTREVIIPIDPGHPEPPRYQILNRIKKECAEEGVLPYCLGLDDTSGGVGDILKKEWSHKVKCFLFGSKPSDNQVSRQDARMASEVFDNRVTELWQQVANFVDNKQIKGMNPDSDYVRQFTSRKIEIVGRKRRLESKPEYKERTGMDSPDDADAVSVLVAVAQSLGARAGMMRETDADTDWEQECREAVEDVTMADFNKALEMYERTA